MRRKLVACILFPAVFLSDSTLGDEIPSDVQALTAAYSEWITLAEFEATFQVSGGLSMKRRHDIDVTPRYLKAKKSGLWCKRGEYWHLSSHNAVAPVVVTEATATSPGATKNLSWERLCANDYIVEYLTDDPANQAGLTRRVQLDGLVNPEFHAACHNSTSFMNPTGGKIYDAHTGEFRLPGIPKDIILKWRVQESSPSHTEVVATWTTDGVRNEVSLRFRTQPEIPVLEHIRSSYELDDEGNAEKYFDVYLSGFQKFDCGVELPARMESRSYPVFFDREGEQQKAMSVLIWNVDFHHFGAPDDSALSVDFDKATSLTGFGIEPTGKQGWSLVDFKDEQPIMIAEISPLATPRRSPVWLGPALLVILIILAFSVTRYRRIAGRTFRRP